MSDEPTISSAITPHVVNILIVDDNPANLKVLNRIISEKGYNVRPSLSGKLALLTVNASIPDLILLDIQMPDMNGYEVCEQLKANPKTADIPIIFISAMDSVNDKIKAFEMGGVDYITKPFQVQEVLARIDIHLTLHQLQLQSEIHNEALKSEIKERKEAESQLLQSNEELEITMETLQESQKQLIQSERLASLGNMVAGVAHEINTPIGLGVTESSYINDETKIITDLLDNNKLSQSQLETYLDTVNMSSASVLRNLTRAANLIFSFKQVAVDQTSEMRRTFQLKQYIDEILMSLQSKIKKSNHQITVDCPETLEISSYPGIFSQITTNLVMNSLQHGFENKDKGEIFFNISQTDKILNFEYGDNGIGLEPQAKKQIFDPFFTTKRNKGGTGLGMNIIYNLVSEKLNGQISCESSPGQGILFRIEIPLDGSCR